MTAGEGAWISSWWMSQLSRIERTLARGSVRAVYLAATHEVIADAGHDVVLERGVAVLGLG